jgi:hypothetical protein
VGPLAASPVARPHVHGGAGPLPGTLRDDVLHVVRRDPSRGVLHRVLRAHLETFLARLTDEHGARRLPGYIEKELRAALACGDLTHGFARVRCPSCTLDLTGPLLVQGPRSSPLVRRAQNG